MKAARGKSRVLNQLLSNKNLYELHRICINEVNTNYKGIYTRCLYLVVHYCFQFGVISQHNKCLCSKISQIIEF